MTTPTETVPLTPTAVITALGSILDPEFGLSIVELGLIYDVQLTDTHLIAVMTLTSPYCPAGDVIRDGVFTVLGSLAAGRAVEVQLTWTPAWTPARMSREACEQLGWREMEDV
jgi:metal-sulfur cluster biosynthetic enzyme